MSRLSNRKNQAGSKKSNEPRLLGSIVSEVLQGWNRNTHLCVDLKTILRSDRVVKNGKNYPGVLRRDEICEDYHNEEHFTFVETLPNSAGKRNPHVFQGEYITITRRDDGSLRPNFKPMPKINKDFSIERYVIGVSNELLWALEGLVEEEE